MPKRSLPSWLVDARFWMTIFIVAFWPVVWFTHIVGCLVLLAVVFGAWYGLQAIDRRRLQALDGSGAEHLS